MKMIYWVIIIAVVLIGLAYWMGLRQGKKTVSVTTSSTERISAPSTATLRNINSAPAATTEETSKVSKTA